MNDLNQYSTATSQDRGSALGDCLNKTPIREIKVVRKSTSASLTRGTISRKEEVTGAIVAIVLSGAFIGVTVALFTAQGRWNNYLTESQKQIEIQRQNDADFKVVQDCIDRGGNLDSCTP